MFTDHVHNYYVQWPRVQLLCSLTTCTTTMFTNHVHNYYVHWPRVQLLCSLTTCEKCPECAVSAAAKLNPWWANWSEVPWTSNTGVLFLGEESVTKHLLLLLLLLLKWVSSERLGESENTLLIWRPQPHTNDPWIEENEKIVWDKKKEQIRPTWKHWLCT